MTVEMTQVPVRALGRMHDRIAALEEALREILGVEVTAPEGGHEEVAQIHRIARDALGVATGVEPIPERVYWAPLADNFYSADDKGMGLEFYRKWKPRRAEFPQGESHGWGPGSYRNPFKNTDGVRVCEHCGAIGARHEAHGPRCPTRGVLGMDKEQQG